jgi:peptide/nickel transport system permease protein
MTSVGTEATAQLRDAGLSARSRPPVLDTTIRILRSPVGASSAGVILLLALAALFAPVVAPYDPIQISLDKFQGPSFQHLMGTDNVGRDVFSRVLHGSRISLYVAFLAVTFGTIVGCALGLISGFVGGWFDLVTQRVVDAMLAFPGLVLAMALVAVLGPSTTNGLLAIAVVIIPGNSRVIRSAVLSVKESTFVEAAYSTGAGPVRVLLRHILPQVVAPILILISAVLGGAILIETALSFLGLGTQPPKPSWGLMLSGSGREYMEQAPWLAIFPGLAISVTVLAFNMLGDVVRDVLDPRLRGSQ